MKFSVASNEDYPVCPCCGSQLKHYDTRRRIHKTYEGEKEYYLIERARCINPSCRKIHNVLPDCLIPYKHYDSDVIEAYIDDDVLVGDDTPGNNCFDNDDNGCEKEAVSYPCERTISRWENCFDKKTEQIEGHLRQAFHRLDFLKPVLENTTDSLLVYLRIHKPGWLRKAIHYIYNFGHLQTAVVST